jgi:trk system potassium uptake protein TrkH
MQVPGVMALASLLVCWFFKEYYAIWPFSLTALISIGLGQLLYRLFRPAKVARVRQALLIAALSWFVVFLLGAIPHLTIASHLATLVQTPQTVREFQNPWNALFESVSGFTTTGLTMATDSSQLPHCLQWWRSFTQWIGGVGVMLATLSILHPTDNVKQLYSAEARQEDFAPTLKKTVQEIWLIYLLYTVLGVLLLKVAGMSWWEAVNHSMSSIATGGFAITGNSFVDYGTPVKLAAIPIAIAGAISFSIHNRVLTRGEFSALWKDERMRAFWLLLAVGTVTLLVQHYSFAGSLQWEDSFFAWTSALTTSGFSSFDEHTWSSTTKLLLSLGMTFGAVSGSACGGLKLDRLVVLYKSMVWQLRLLYQQSPEDLRYELNGECLTEIEAHRHLKAATVLATLWLGLLGAGTLVLRQMVEAQYTSSDVLLETASALGTTGLSIGITNPDLVLPGKLILMLLMWMGRLEIIAVMILFSWLLRPVGQVLSH